MTKKILLISVILVLMFLGFGYYFDTHISYEKLTSKDDIPKAVLEKIYETKLERGTYVFTNHFTDEYAYLVICGGEEFKQGYEVNLKKISFKDDWKRYIEVKIAELRSNSSPTYCKDKTSPFVIFRIKNVPEYTNDFMMLQVEVTTDNNTTFPVINWWGNTKREAQEKLFSYKILDNKADIPQVVWNKLKSYEFDKDCPAIYEFSPSNAIYSFDIEDFYLVVSPSNNKKSNFKIEIENIIFNRVNNTKHISFTIAYREHLNSATTGIINDLGYQFQVVKISSEAFKEKKQRIHDLIMDVSICIDQSYVIENTTSYYSTAKQNFSPLKDVPDY